MDIIVKMRVKPGDKSVDKATIKMFDSTGMQVEGQFLLEGETAETALAIPAEGHCEIRATERPHVIDVDQKAAVPADLTPKDPLAKRQEPHPEPTAPKAPGYGGDTHPGSGKVDLSKGIDTSKEDHSKRK